MAKDESLKAIMRTANDVEAIAKKATEAAIAAGKEAVARLEHDVANARKQTAEASDSRRAAERERDSANTENQGNKAKYEKVLQERNNFSSEAKTATGQLKIANEEISLITGRLKDAKKTANAATTALDNAGESANKTIRNLQSDITVRDENIETYSVQIKELTARIIALKKECDDLNATVTQLRAGLAGTNKGKDATKPASKEIGKTPVASTGDKGTGKGLAPG